MERNYRSINIFEKLKEKYKGDIRESIISSSIIQSKDGVFLETISSELLEDGLEKEFVERINLECIRQNEQGELTFNPIDPIEVNARKLIADTSQYLIMCVSNLFHEEACKRINNESNAVVIYQ